MKATVGRASGCLSVSGRRAAEIPNHIVLQSLALNLIRPAAVAKGWRCSLIVVRTAIWFRTRPLIQRSDVSLRRPRTWPSRGFGARSSSTSRPPKPSASPSPKRCWLPPTRWSSSQSCGRGSRTPNSAPASTSPPGDVSRERAQGTAWPARRGERKVAGLSVRGADVVIDRLPGVFGHAELIRATWPCSPSRFPSALPLPVPKPRTQRPPS
jgi:hypothetical protein